MEGECSVQINDKNFAHCDSACFPNGDYQFQKLSYHFFGKPGPSVNVSGRDKPQCKKKQRDHTDHSTTAQNIKSQQSNCGVGRCLVCYSVIGGNGSSTEKSDNLLEFVTSVLSLPLGSSGNNVQALAVKYMLEEAVGRLPKVSCSHLCQICDNVCRHLLSKQREIRKLQQEVNELRQKIVAAVMLSTALAEKSSADQEPEEPLNKIRRLIGGKRLKVRLLPPPPTSGSADLRGEQAKRESVESEPVVDWDLSRSLEKHSGAGASGDLVDISPSPIDIKIELNNLKQEGPISTSPKVHQQPPPSSKNQFSDSSSLSSSSYEDDDDDEYACKQREKKPQEKMKRIKKSKPTCWREEEGKLFYKDIQVKKTEDNRFLCPFECLNRSYDLRSHLVRHMNLCHLEKQNDGFTCEICGAKLCNRAGLHRHKRVKHLGIKPHACDFCGKKFGKKQEKIVHERKHTGDRPFACHLCPSRFTARVCLTQHIQLQHLEGLKLEPNKCKRWSKHEGAFRCDICGDRLTTLVGLKRHKRVQHFGIKPYTCEHCDKKFAEKANLRIHLRIHTDERPYPCDICSESFRVKRGLNLHILNKHPEEAPTQESAEAHSEYVLGC